MLTLYVNVIALSAFLKIYHSKEFPRQVFNLLTNTLCNKTLFTEQPGSHPTKSIKIVKKPC